MKVIQIQLDQYGCGNKSTLYNFLLLVKEISILYQKFNVMLL
jgi:hypothetical protein